MFINREEILDQYLTACVTESADDSAKHMVAIIEPYIRRLERIIAMAPHARRPENPAVHPPRDIAMALIAKGEW